MNYILLSIVLALIYGGIHYGVYINFDKYKKPIQDQSTYISKSDSKLLVISVGLCVSILIYESLKYFLKKENIFYRTSTN